METNVRYCKSSLRSRHHLHSSLSTLSFRGRGTALAVDEVPTRAPAFVLPLSITCDSDLTANLIGALRAARENACCPSEAAVRALNLCGGVNPSNPPRPAMGFAPPDTAATLRSPRYGVSRPTEKVSP